MLFQFFTLILHLLLDSTPNIKLLFHLKMSIYSLDETAFLFYFYPLKVFFIL